MNIFIFLVGVMFVGLSMGRKYHGYPEADWTLLSSEQPEDGSYTCRLYPPSKWVTMAVNGRDFDDVGNIAFGKLHKYIKGDNHMNQKLPMTVPVITTFTTPSCSFCNSTFTMGFYLPPSGQDPPQPTDPALVLRERPEKKIYVRKFGGYANSKSWKKEAGILFESMIRNGVRNIDQSHFIAAGYNSPYWFLYRRNEVWLVLIDSNDTWI